MKNIEKMHLFSNFVGVIQYKSGFFAIGFFCFIGYYCLFWELFLILRFPNASPSDFFLHRIFLLIGCFFLIFVIFRQLFAFFRKNFEIFSFFAFFSYFYSLLAVHFVLLLSLHLMDRAPAAALPKQKRLSIEEKLWHGL